MSGSALSKPRLSDGTFAAQSRAAETELTEIIGDAADAEESRADSVCAIDLDRSTDSDSTRRRHPGYVWKLRTAADVQRSIAAVARQTARGEIPPARARALNTLLATLLRSFQAVDAEQRLAAIVEKLRARGIEVA